MDFDNLAGDAPYHVATGSFLAFVHANAGTEAAILPTSAIKV